LATCLGSSAGPRRREYIDHLEDVILRFVDLMAKSPKPPSPQRLGLGLSLAALALRKADENRYTKILTSLKRKCRGRAEDQITKAVQYMEGKMPVLVKPVAREHP
jgi:hypothetical protein